MNKGGIPYSISNPPGSTTNWVGTPGEYSADFDINNVNRSSYSFQFYKDKNVTMAMI